MPKENKKRGRRMEGTKRKHEEAEEDHTISQDIKRQKPTEDNENELENGQDFVPLLEGDGDAMEGAYPALETQFYGMLDEQEQEYFKHADEMLEMNAFEDAEQRELFLGNVWREAASKELKIANSQSCSRLMERLIQLSTPSQLKGLFREFYGKFVHLMTHRFASHCCEALFRRAATVVANEVPRSKKAEKAAKAESAAADGESEPSMEQCFLDTMAEIEPNIGFLMNDRFASHVLRVLLVVFSGESLDSAANKQLMQSKNKETIKVEGTETAETQEQTRRVPGSFSPALEKLLSGSVAGLDTEKLRALATTPNGNPTLQLLLRLELSHFGKQRAQDEASVIRTLLPDDPITDDSSSAAFINAMIYDAIGSRLVETLVISSPAKLFKNLYGTLFKERLASYARNEIASFVACRILERLGKDELLAAHEQIAPTIPSLLERNRTNIVRTLIERCTVRGIDTKAIAAHINSTWDGPDGFEVKKLLKIDNSPDKKEKDVKPEGIQPSANTTGKAFIGTASEPVKAHFNVLAQAMLLVPGALSGLVLDALIGLDPDTLFAMSKDPIVSRTLQAAITSRTASIITVRKLVQHFYGHMGEMALDKAASHVVDCIWEGTHGLAFIRERIAEELAENEAQLRESPCGRAVWKNWKMDMYKRKRGDWVRQSKNKASNDGFQSFSEIEDIKKSGSGAPATAGEPLFKKKSPLELARERHAKNKAAKESGKGKGKAGAGGRSSGGEGGAGAGAGTGSNSTPVAPPAAASS